MTFYGDIMSISKVGVFYLELSTGFLWTSSRIWAYLTHTWPLQCLRNFHSSHLLPPSRPGSATDYIYVHVGLT